MIIILDTITAIHRSNDAAGLLCDACKYTALISCLLICIFTSSRTRTKAAHIQTIVFGITLVADFFLLFTPNFSAGVLIFIIAHLCALLRYRPGWFPPVGAGACALFILTIYFAPELLHTNTKLTLLIAACASYTMLIISVTLSTFFSKHPQKFTRLACIGMLMFISCDINVAIFNVMPENSAPHTIATVLMWFFYLPAQTLIAISVYEPRLKQNTEEQLALPLKKMID
jgi:hypothetical membrane protein